MSRRLLAPLVLLALPAALPAAPASRMPFGLDAATVRGTHSSGGSATERFERLRAGFLESARLYSVRGAQLYVSRQGRSAEEHSLAFGFRTARGNEPVTEETLMPAGELVRPVIAAALFAGGRHFDEGVRLPQSGLHLPPGLQLGHLLQMTSGLDIAGTGYAAPNRAAEDLDGYLARNVRFVALPATEYRHSFANGAVLQRMLGPGPEALDRKLREAVFRPLRMNATVLVPGRGSNYSHGMVLSGRYYFELADDAAAPGANRLFVSARDYGRFLEVPPPQWLWPIFRFQESLGGAAPGLAYMRSRSDFAWFRVESQIPGSYAQAIRVQGAKTAAGFLPAGVAVVIATPAVPAFGRDVLSLVQETLFADVFAPEELAVRRKPVVYPKKPTFEPVEVAPLEKQFAELEGYYRPDAAVPAAQKLLAFLNDTRLSITRKHGLELAGVFREDAAVELVPIGRDLFLARGNARMHGWRLLVVRKHGRIVGLVTDGMRYSRVPLLFSFWGITLLLGLAIVLPVVTALFWVVLRGRRKQT